MPYSVVEPEFVAQKLRDPSYQIIDVRTPMEYAAHHVPEAILIPIQVLGKLIDMVDPERPVVFLCEHANRSSAACRMFHHLFKEVYNMAGGMEKWMRLGLSTVNGMDENGELWLKRLTDKGSS